MFTGAEKPGGPYRRGTSAVPALSPVSLGVSEIESDMPAVGMTGFLAAFARISNDDFRTNAKPGHGAGAIRIPKQMVEKLLETLADNVVLLFGLGL